MHGTINQHFERDRPDQFVGKANIFRKKLSMTNDKDQFNGLKSILEIFA